LGQNQTVIKPLGRLFKTLRGISGSSILGSGEVALILDVNSLVELTTSAGADAGAAQPGGASIGGGNLASAASTPNL
jgi:two-component system chemotaxis sensor kinase CheA